METTENVIEQNELKLNDLNKFQVEVNENINEIVKVNDQDFEIDSINIIKQPDDKIHRFYASNEAKESLSYLEKNNDLLTQILPFKLESSFKAAASINANNFALKTNNNQQNSQLNFNSRKSNTKLNSSFSSKSHYSSNSKRRENQFPTESRRSSNSNNMNQVSILNNLQEKKINNNGHLSKSNSISSSYSFNSRRSFNSNNVNQNSIPFSLQQEEKNNLNLIANRTNNSSSTDGSSSLINLNIKDPVLIRGSGNITIFGVCNKFCENFPSQLTAKLAPEEFRDTIKQINNILTKELANSSKWLIFGSLFCCCTLGCSFLPVIYMNKKAKLSINKLLALENQRLYFKLGLKWRLTKMKCNSNSLYEYVLLIEFLPTVLLYQPD